MSWRYKTAEVDCDEEQIRRRTAENVNEVPAGADADAAAAAAEAGTHGGPSTSSRLNSTCSYHHAVLVWPDDQDFTERETEVFPGPRCRPTRPEEVSYRGMNLTMACARGDLPLVAMLLAEGSDSGLNMYSADSEGNTPLHYACLSDNPETIPFLVRKAARNAASALIESRNASMETPLLRAAAGGEVAMVRALLEAGADTFVWDVNGNTVFHNAARSGRLWVVAYFLSTREKDNSHQNDAPATPAAAVSASASAGDGDDGDGCGCGDDSIDEGDETGLSSIAIESCDTGGTVTLSDCGIGNSTAAVDYAKRLFDGRDVEDQDHRRGAESDEHRANSATGGPSNIAGQHDERSGLGFPFVHTFDEQEGVAGGAPETPLGDRSTVKSLLHRFDRDGHTALDWACYAGHTAVARLLIANGLDPFSTDPGGRTCLHWAASQGRRETCRYLVLLGLDPRLRDATGADAFQLGENYPSIARDALVLAEAVRCRAVKDRPSGRLSYGDRSCSNKRHAPTPGSGMGEQISTEGVEARRSSAAAAHTVVPPERLNPTRAWVVVSYALPVCGVWALSFALPWWAWLLTILAAAMVLAKAEAAAAAALSYRRSSGVGVVERSGGRGRYGKHLTNDVGNRRGQASADFRILYVPELLLAPEKYLALWAGMALCFVSLTVSVAARGLIDTGAKDSDVGGWSFAGASIFLSGSGSGSNDGDSDRSVITTRAWLACATVVALVLMLALWSTLLAGDGRRAAAEASVAASTWAKAGDGGFTGTEVGGGGVLGWGDPGLVRIRPSEDMEELVKAVAENEGAPEARTLCRTCIVRKPIRSKHCASCGFCVGRMDHHCVWINNCVGCGNHRRFVGFVLFQLAYAALFLWVSTSALVEELSGKGGLRGVAARLLSKEYFPVVLLSIASAVGVLMLSVIAYDQVRNMFANLTINERVNRGRYPWLVVGPGGAHFNHYDRGPWENFLEFWGIGSGVVSLGGTSRRHPRDYLEGYEIPTLDAKQRVRLKYRASSARFRTRQGSRGSSGGDTLALRGVPQNFTPASIPVSASGAPRVPPTGVRARHGDESGSSGNATTAAAAAAAGGDPHNLEGNPSRSVVLGVLGSSAVV